MDAAKCAAVLLSVQISYHFHGCTALLVALVVVSGAILNTHLYLYLTSKVNGVYPESRLRWSMPTWWTTPQSSNLVSHSHDNSGLSWTVSVPVNGTAYIPQLKNLKKVQEWKLLLSKYWHKIKQWSSARAATCDNSTFAIQERERDCKWNSINLHTADSSRYWLLW